MPSYYNLPAVFGQDTVEDTEKFQAMAFWLAKGVAARVPKYDIFNQLYGDVDWESNQGNVMRTARPEPSPVGEVFFFPENITSLPRKNIYETGESIEEARVKWHRYESKPFSFLPSFKDFYRDRIKYNLGDITRQIVVSNNLFIRTVIWHKAPNVIIAGSGLSYTPAPSGDGSADNSTAKSSAWAIDIAPLIKTGLTLKVLDLAATILREDLAVPYFEGTKNTNKNTEIVKGKYILIGETGAYNQLKWDPDVEKLRSANFSLLEDGYNGDIMGQITNKFDPYQIRFNADGTFPVPEVVNQTTGKVRPNPQHTSAEFGVALMCGEDAYSTIKVGPPTREFAAQNMNQKKFYSLKWNGEVQMTDQILIQTVEGQYELNRYGLLLQLIAQLTHGIVPRESMNVVPIIYKRERQAVV